jgi:cytochrome c peroxidase
MGCQPPTKPQAKTGDRAVAKASEADGVIDDSADAKTPGAKPADVKPADTKPADTKPADTKPADAKLADAKSIDAKPIDAKPIEPSKTTRKVLLGSPELTAGIPGEGPLTEAQVKAWLDDPKNSETLEVELPLGLSLGAQQIVGLKENPLTQAKIELGRQLYFDPRLSGDTTISCATCHNPTTGYAANTQFGVGIRKQTGNRNSPTAFNRILSGAQFWDGRAASLEEQAVGPIANPIEMGHTHDACVSCVDQIPLYKLQFEKIFGKTSIENIAKAIACFERTLVTGASPYDYRAALQKYLNLDPDDLASLEQDDPAKFKEYQALKADVEKHPMSESATRGQTLFFSDKSRCATCHAGANFTDEKYHNLGVGMDKEKPDLGRYEQTKDEKDKGAFKTPSLRNVALTAPYMHDGSQKTLQEVVDWYAKGGHPNPHLSDKIVKLDLSEQDKLDLVEFLQALTGPLPKVETGRLPPKE